MRGDEPTWVRVVVLRPGTCGIRIRWWSGGRILGDRRSFDVATDLRVPVGPVAIEISDLRRDDDPDRLATARGSVTTRAGWRSELTVHLQPGAIVSGRVRRSDLAPARFAEVAALLPDGRTVTTRTDGRGEYLLSGLPGGLVRVGAQRRGLTSIQQPVHAVAGRACWAELDLVLPVVPAPVLAPATLGGAVRGRVIDQDGEVLPLAVVEVRDARGTVLTRGRADRRGEFLVGGHLPAGSGLTVAVHSGPDRIVVDRREVRGVGARPGHVTDLGQVVVTRSPRPAAPHRHPRTPARGMRLPSIRV